MPVRVTPLASPGPGPPAPTHKAGLSANGGTQRGVGERVTAWTTQPGTWTLFCSRGAWVGRLEGRGLEGEELAAQSPFPPQTAGSS